MIKMKRNLLIALAIPLYVIGRLTHAIKLDLHGILIGEAKTLIQHIAAFDFHAGLPTPTVFSLIPWFKEKWENGVFDAMVEHTEIGCFYTE